MTLSVNYRGGFAKLSDLGMLVITRDYVAFLLLQLRLCVYFIFFVPSIPSSRGPRQLDSLGGCPFVVNKSDFTATQTL